MYKEKQTKKNKVLSILLIVLYGLVLIAFLTGRGLSLLPGWGNIVDTYQYYSQAYLLQDHMITKLTSGISYAYAETLAVLINLVGDEKWFVAVYHILLQIITLLFLSAGFRLLFGKAAAYLVGVLYLLSPWMFDSVFLVAPDNYLILFWSIGLFLVAIFFYRGRKKGWYRNNSGEGFLLFLGVFLGILLTWHFYCITLILLFLYSVVRNYSLVEERVRVRNQTLELLELSQESTIDKRLKVEVMPSSSQMLVVFGGIFVGVFATLMKYTGVTGNYLSIQFKWWYAQLLGKSGYGRYQDVALWMILHLSVFLVIGFVFGIFDHTKEKVMEELHEEADAIEMSAPVIREEVTEKDEMTEQIQKPDTETEKKKVELLENPLPLPKKHVKKVMDFDDAPKKDDFDLQLEEGDDFDF